jgi:heat shock protein HslJ
VASATDSAKTAANTAASNANAAATTAAATVSTNANTAASQAADAANQANAAMSAEAAALVKAVGGKSWKLSEVRKGNVATIVDRQKLENDGFGDLFTINFAERVSGKAAPNTFTAPYQVGANNSLKIYQPASTLMAPIYDPERIREKEYFQYLVNAKTWKLNGTKLEIATADADGKDATLVYGN